MVKCNAPGCSICSKQNIERYQYVYSSQQRFPKRAVIRTVLVNVITWVPLIATALAVLASGGGRPALPEQWEAWLAFAAAWAIAISGFLTRIIAHPVVDLWLSKIGASSRPM